jgi:hypothetical protein
MSMNGELRQIPAALMDELEDAEAVEGLMDGPGLSVGKAWNALHYLYCGDSKVGESAISGGEPLDDLDLDTGYGAPQVLTPDEVVAYATALAAQTDDELRAAYDPEAMKKEAVYGCNFDDPAEIEWLLGEARKVRAYYQDAATKGAGMLQFLS